MLDREEFNIFITDSSSKLLSKEIATQLRGRTISYILLPFSFREFLKVKKHSCKKIHAFGGRGKIKRLLKELFR